MKKLINRVNKSYLQLLLLFVAATALLPTTGYSQATPPPPTGGSGGGSLPDSPLGVPFDWKMNLLLAAAGLVFAVIVINKRNRQRVRAIA
jgi:hypothetical protein